MSRKIKRRAGWVEGRKQVESGMETIVGWEDDPLSEEEFSERVASAMILSDLSDIVDERELAEEVFVGPNYRAPNFRDPKTKKFMLVRCFVCKPDGGRGNLPFDMTLGICRWCGARVS